MKHSKAARPHAELKVSGNINIGEKQKESEAPQLHKYIPLLAWPNCASFSARWQSFQNP